MLGLERDRQPGGPSVVLTHPDLDRGPLGGRGIPGEPDKTEGVGFDDRTARGGRLIDTRQTLATSDRDLFERQRLHPGRDRMGSPQTDHRHQRDSQDQHEQDGEAGPHSEPPPFRTISGSDVAAKVVVPMPTIVVL